MTSARNVKLVLSSALLYAVAFSVIFFIQELFLVLPKAFTPGLRPTLFHNNHNWEGDHPLAHLFQGTGALAIFIVGLGFAWWLGAKPPRSAAWRLFVIWMTFNAFFESLPQVVIGAMLPQNDVGMAMNYLRFTPAAKLVAALSALATMVGIGIWLTRALLALAPSPQDIDSPRKRMRFAFEVATLPALMALPLIILSRVPGTLDQVAVFPVLVALIGIPLIQMSARGITTAQAGRLVPVLSIRYPCIAATILILVFQIVLRPGIDFF